MSFDVLELSQIEHDVPGTGTLTPLELLLIECHRNRTADTVVCKLIGLSLYEARRANHYLREKLDCRITEAVRDAADRLEIPRLAELVAAQRKK